MTITIGAHAHRASLPVPPPAGFESHRRISVQPAEATSCLEWSTVELFIDNQDNVAAITLDLFEP